MSIQKDRAGALALVGGAIVGALLEALVEKELLTVHEVRAVLRKPMKGIAPYAQTSVGYEASSIIATMMHDHFPPERGPSGA